MCIFNNSVTEMTMFYVINLYTYYPIFFKQEFLNFSEFGKHFEHLIKDKRSFSQEEQT